MTTVPRSLVTNRPSSARGERHESVAAGVPLASGCFDLGAFDRAGGEAALARAFVEGSDVAPTPGEQDRFAPVS
jgi:hypothetical protein